MSDVLITIEIALVTVAIMLGVLFAGLFIYLHVVLHKIFNDISFIIKTEINKMCEEENNHAAKINTNKKTIR